MQDSPSLATPEFNKRGRLEIYKRADGDWSWRVVSVHNGKNLTPEGYRRRVDMLKILGWMFPGVEPVEVEASYVKPTPPSEPTPEIDLDAPDPFEVQ